MKDLKCLRCGVDMDCLGCEKKRVYCLVTYHISLPVRWNWRYMRVLTVVR